MPWLLRLRELLILDSICCILSSKLSLACLKKSSLVFSSLARVPLKKGSSRKGCRRVIGTWRSLALLLPLSFLSSLLSTTISLPLLEPLLVLILLSLLSFPVSTVVVVSLASPQDRQSCPPCPRLKSLPFLVLQKLPLSL